MFTELMPLITDRAITITVSKLKDTDDQIRVNIVPLHVPFKKPEVGSGDKDLTKSAEKLTEAADALNSPLTIIGTAKEVDAELATALSQYVDGIQHLNCTITEVKGILEAAHKLAEDAKKIKKTPAAPKKADKKYGKGGKIEEDTPPESLFDECDSDPHDVCDDIPDAVSCDDVVEPCTDFEPSDEDLQPASEEVA